MAETYTLHVAGLTRELTICKVNGLHNSSSLYKITNGYQTTPYNSIK